MNKTTLNSQKEKHSMLSLRRVTSNSKVLVAVIELFLSTLSLRRATCSRRPPGCFRRFLSTLSLRRATIQPQRAVLVPPISIHALPMVHFLFLHPISIHALLAESDRDRRIFMPKLRYFYPRSPCGERPPAGKVRPWASHISIHALLAESDQWHLCFGIPGQCISIHALLAESDSLCVTANGHHSLFLSTLSLRRATTSYLCKT